MFQDFFLSLFIILGPIFFFYRGDPWLYSHFSNWTMPNASRDESYFDIQQTIGATCYLSRKCQSNLPFGNVVAPPLGMNIPQKFYFPLWWMDTQVSISSEQASDMKTALDFYNIAVLWEIVLLFGGGGGALIFFSISIYLFYKRRHYWKATQWEALIHDSSLDEEEGVPIGYMEDVARRTPDSSTSSRYDKRGSM